MTLQALLDSLLACPDCPPVRLARSRVLTDDLASNAFAVGLPFALTGAVASWLARKLDRAGARDAAGDEPERRRTREGDRDGDRTGEEKLP